MEKRDKRIRTYEDGLRVAPLLVPAATITTMVFIIPLAMFSGIVSISTYLESLWRLPLRWTPSRLFYLITIIIQ